MTPLEMESAELFLLPAGRHSTGRFILAHKYRRLKQSRNEALPAQSFPYLILLDTHFR